MDDAERFREVGLELDLAPPLIDDRRPLAIAFGGAPDGLRALSAIEIERFEVAGADAARIDHRRLWSQAIDALVRLPDGTELWHVLATRRPTGARGALLRVGWIAVGRAPTALAAAALSERTNDAALEIFASTFETYALAQVSDPRGLLDLARAVAAPHVQAIRRVAWSAPLALWRAEQRSEAMPRGIVLPWSGGLERRGGADLEGWTPWAPLAQALAEEPDHAAFVVRIAPAQPPREVVDRATADLAAIVEAYDRVPADRILLPRELVTDLGADRIRAFQRRCLRVEALLCTSRVSPVGLGAIAMSSLAPAPGGDRRARSLVPALELVPLEGDARWSALDAHDAGAWVAPEDAWPVVRTCEAPVDERSPLPCGRSRHYTIRTRPPRGTTIGDADHGRARAAVHLPEEDRLRHVYCVGQTGTGKSTLLLNMIAQDLEHGHGVTLLDPHGTLIDEVLARVPRARAGDVVVIDAADHARYVPLNPLFVDDADPVAYVARRDLTIDELLDTFDTLYDLRQVGGPMFEHYFRIFAALLIGARRPAEYQPILPLIEIVMGKRALSNELVRRLEAEDPITAQAYKNLIAARGESDLANMVPYVVSKLTRFYAPSAARRLLCQPSCLDFDRVLRERQIVLISMTHAHIGKEAAALIARQVILRLWLAAMRRPTSPDAPAHFIYADEFHHFASERFAALLSEARKFRLGLVLAHQYTSQLVARGGARVLDAVLGNVATVIAFRVGTNDAKLLEAAFAPRVSATDISGLPDHTALVRSAGALANVPFTLYTRPPPAPGAPSLAPAIRRLSSLAFGRDREIVDAEFARAFGALDQLAKGAGRG